MGFRKSLAQWTGRDLKDNLFQVLTKFIAIKTARKTHPQSPNPIYRTEAKNPIIHRESHCQLLTAGVNQQRPATQVIQYSSTRTIITLITLVLHPGD